MTGEDQLSGVLSEFARTMLTEFPIQGILDQLVRRIVEILPITGAGVTLISASAIPRYLAASDDSAMLFERIQTELGEGPCLAAYNAGEAVVVPDLRDETRFVRFVPQALEAGLAAVFTFPLNHGDAPLGALDLYRGTPGPLNEREMATAQTLADVTSAYIVNAQARADLKSSSERSYQSAMHDPLTGLPNRSLLMERLDHAALRNLRLSDHLAVLFIDLDRFKAVNDRYGHAVGDELLVAVARRIAEDLRPGDTLARLSGDEFVVLCEDLKSEQQAEAVASRIVAVLGEPFRLSTVVVEVSASVGVAVASHGDRASRRLIHDADTAMYRVKHKGGDDHQAIGRRQRRLVNPTVDLTGELNLALERGQLRTEYQPIVNARDGIVQSAEALLRWDHPRRGVIAPTMLVGLAEQSGAIVDIGRWVLQRACDDRRGWSADDGRDAIGVTVNMSAFQLMAPGFVDMVTAVLKATGTVPELLTLEITESVFVQDAERARLVLAELKQLGAKLALDDFGTGYSSLSYLKHFPVDVVKIDRDFVADMAVDKASHAIVSTLIDLCHRLGLTVVSEGVETAVQHAELTRLGSDSCQGFYFSPPMSAACLDSLIRNDAAGAGRHALPRAMARAGVAL